VPQYALSVAAAGEDPAELDGVHRHALTARRPRQVEGAGLIVSGSPLGDDVGDNATVVPGVDVELPIGGAGKVDPVHPHVPGEARVEQVADPLPPDRLGQVQQYTYEGTDSVQSLIVGRAITGISAFV
jgi:hypothetical protein